MAKTLFMEWHIYTYVILSHTFNCLKTRKWTKLWIYEKICCNKSMFNLGAIKEKTNLYIYISEHLWK